MQAGGGDMQHECNARHFNDDNKNYMNELYAIGYIFTVRQCVCGQHRFFHNSAKISAIGPMESSNRQRCRGKISLKDA